MSRSVDIKNVRTGDCSLDYFTFGNGDRAFVILPGISLRSVMLSASAVAEAYSCLAGDFKTYVFDCRKAPPEGYSLRELASDTAAAMEALGISGACVLGCSMGGMVAQWLAIDHPQLVSRAVFASTLPRSNRTIQETMGLWHELAVLRDRQALNRSISHSVYSDAYYRTYAAAFALLENSGTEEELQRFSVYSDAILHFNAYDELDKVQCDALVLGAWNDAVTAPVGSLEIAEKLGCSLYMYPGYSHAVFDEAPDFKARVLEFFR